jgi:ABC-2 type transport system permease protein
MKIIYSIAKNEFRYLFYSPVAWFVLLVFLIQCAIFYSNPVLSTASYQDIMLENNPDFKGFSSSLTLGLFLKTEFFPGIIRNLYLFIPILTMGLISRETNNSTSALLYSSPVNLRKIVLGKYLGIMLYNLLFVLIILLFMTAAFFSIDKVDYGALIAAIIGFYLLICAYSAIGLFMSSLTSYQIVSALGTFTAIFVLSRIGGLWQRYDLVRDLTYFLSLQNRTFKMLTGLLVTKDIIYFLVVTIMFVLFTMIRLKNSQESIPWYKKAARYTVVMIMVLTIGYISSRPALTGYLDTTATQQNTIHPRTQKMLSEFGDSTLEVTLYTNLLGDGLTPGLPESRNADYLASLWEPYLRFKPDIRFNYVLYYDNDPSLDDSMVYRSIPGMDLKGIAKERADLIDADLDMFRSPEEIRQHIQLGPEKVRLVMQLKYKGRTAWLRTFNDPMFWPDEVNMTSAFRRLLDPSMPLISYITGNLERSSLKSGEREYFLHSAARISRGSLVNTGFDVDTVNLDLQEIPSATTALVLADPKTTLSLTVMNKLSNYISQGGNMMITGEPGKQYVLNPFLHELGVQFANGQLVQPSFHETPDKVRSYLAPPVAGLSEGMGWLKQLKPTDSLDLSTPGATAVYFSTDKGFIADTLARTHLNSTWLKAGSLVIDSILPPFNPAKGDTAISSFTTSLKLTRKIKDKEQRVIVTGDADYASNLRLSTGAMNGSFLLSGYSWLVYNRFPIHTPRKKAEDILLTIGTKTATIQKTVFVWVLPAAFLLAATVLLIRRKRK